METETSDKNTVDPRILVLSGMKMSLFPILGAFIFFACQSGSPASTEAEKPIKTETISSSPAPQADHFSVLGIGGRMTTPEGYSSMLAPRIEGELGKKVHLTTVQHKDLASILTFLTDSSQHIPPAVIILDCYTEELQTDMDPLAYRASLNQVLSLAQAQKIPLIVLTPPMPSEQKAGLRRKMLPFVNQIRELAALFQVQLVDVWSLYASHDQQQGFTLESLLAPDGQTPNETGHDRIAEEISILILYSAFSGE
ncbi:MAG: SGNH/GDSL hydrolase family protein [Bacteroidota bacterium]